MELYSFFTKPTVHKTEIATLHELKDELKDICLSVDIVERRRYDGKYEYFIHGTMWGEDTMQGDTDLRAIFYDTEYYWLNIKCPTINNF